MGVAEQRRWSRHVAPVRATQRSARDLFDVVESKIQVPLLRPGTVSRTALVNRVRATSAGSVVTVIAPAGYGKTTLLAQLAARESRPAAWITIDERDGDPIVLLRHVAAALDRLERLDPSVFEALAAAPGNSIWTSIVPRLGAAVSRFEKPLVIVLDDAHLLRSRASLEAVGALTDHLTDASTLVISGRSMPRLPAASLRAAGKLIEVDVADLALSPREGQLLFRGADAELSLSEATELVRHCEGWPAALYLAALALRGDEGHVRGIEAMKLCGGERHVADYLRSEYLSRLRPDTLRFLRRTSVLTRFCGELGDAVLQEEGSGRQLERIERSNLFLVPLDRRGVWYRYHRLFGDLLREELGRREPELVPVLHRRAADWYEAHADPESALEHAYAAADFRRAARLVTTIALPVYYSGRAAVVERWLARFDDPVLLRRHPGVALQGSWVHALRGRAAEARRWLQIAEEGRFRGKLADGSTSLRAWIAVLRAAMCRDGDAHMVADAKAALSALPEGSLLRPSALVVLGAAYTLIGESERADATFAAAAAEAERVGAIDAGIIAISERSLLASARSDLAAADELARAAHDRVGGAHLDGYATSAIAFVASARVSLRHGRWDEARAQLAQAQRLGPPLRSAVFPWLSLQTHLEVGRAHLALRDTHALRSDLAEINDFLRTQPHAGRLVDQVQALAQEAERLCPPGDEETSGLTAAELRLVPLLATHLSFREIGAQLYLSRNTIKTQAISVYRKLGVSSRSEAIDRAVGLGLFAGHGAHTR